MDGRDRTLAVNDGWARAPEVGPIIHYYQNLSLLSFHHHNAFYTAEALAYDGIPLLDSNECEV